MTTRLEAERPLYFGAHGELFGLYHPAATPAKKAVLLCPPLGQEHIRCHRLYRQLARTLAGEGMAVLRFDYYGSGDSAGASADVDLDRCVADTMAAANELRRLSGTDHIVAFGARLGGSIAMMAAARLASLVVWDPVLDGSYYVMAQDALQAELGHDPQRFTTPRMPTDVAGQWLGFAVSDGLRGQLASLRLSPSTVPTLVLDSLPSTAVSRWNALDASCTEIKTLQLATPWDDLARAEIAILSHPLIQAVSGHLRATV